jgi:hypothetical protein
LSITNNKTAIAFSRTTRQRSPSQKQQNRDRTLSTINNKTAITLHKEQNRDRIFKDNKTAISLFNYKQQNSDRN